MNNNLDGESKGVTNHIFNKNSLLNALVSQNQNWGEVTEMSRVQN